MHDGNKVGAAATGKLTRSRMGVILNPFLAGRALLGKAHSLGVHFSYGTRREELLLDEGALKMVWAMRRMLSAVGANEGIELLLNRIAKTESNAQFLASLTKGTEGSNPA